MLHCYTSRRLVNLGDLLVVADEVRVLEVDKRVIAVRGQTPEAEGIAAFVAGKRDFLRFVPFHLAETFVGFTRFVSRRVVWAAPWLREVVLGMLTAIGFFWS